MVMSYREAAEALWGQAGTYAHDAYARLRDTHYPELPEQLPIVIGLTAYGHCLGLTRHDWTQGARITLSSTVFRQGHEAVDDLLMHEMLHAWLNAAGLDTAHDSEPWYAAVRRLSPSVLGETLGVVRGADRQSVRVPNPAYVVGGTAPKTVVRKKRVANVHVSVANWPQAFRPEGFYAGPSIACPTY